LNLKIRDARLPLNLSAAVSADPLLRPYQTKLADRIRAFASNTSNLSMHYKILWHKERVDAALRGLPQEIMPVTMEFVPSLECVYQCPHCTYSGWKERTIADLSKRVMPYELMMTLLDKLEEADIKGVIFTGGGEPFANRDTLKGLEYAGGKTGAFQTGLFTNGFLLSERSIQVLAGLPLAFIRLSLNTADPGDYMRFHGLDSLRYFERVKRNIALLARAASENPTEFNLSAIINKTNVDRMTSIGTFLKDLMDSDPQARINTVQIKPVINYGQIDPDTGKQISADIAERAREGFEAIREMLASYPIDLVFAASLFEEAVERSAEDPDTTNNCLSVNLAGSVAYDGRVYLCSERDGDPRFMAGDLSKDDLRTIWTGQQRTRLLSERTPCPPSCKLKTMNGLLGELTDLSPLSPAQIIEMQSFLDIIRNGIDPGAVNFI